MSNNHAEGDWLLMESTFKNSLKNEKPLVEIPCFFCMKT